MGRKKNPHKKHMSQCKWCNLPNSKELNELYVARQIDEKQIMSEYGLSRQSTYNHIRYFDLRLQRNQDLDVDTLRAICGKPVNMNQVTPANQIAAAKALAEIDGKMGKNAQKEDKDASKTQVNIFGGADMSELLKIAFPKELKKLPDVERQNDKKTIN